MRATFVREKKPRSDERGFALLDVMIGIAIMSGMLVAMMGSTWHGSDDPHQAALALQLAMSEARGLAMNNANENPNAATPGATVLVASDPNNATKSVITIYSSRPLVNEDPSEFPAYRDVVQMKPEFGRPPVSVTGRFRIMNNSVVASDDFAITIAPTGQVQFAPAYSLGDAARPTLINCEDGTIIQASTGPQVESHPVSCADAIFDASASVPARVNL